MRHLIAAALFVAGTVQAGEVIATRVVDAPNPGQVLILELSNFPPEPDVCGKGTFMGRIVMENPAHPNLASRINLGCWRWAADAWGGRIKYSGWDQVNNKPISIELPITAVTTTPAFKEWIDYSGI